MSSYSLVFIYIVFLLFFLFLFLFIFPLFLHFSSFFHDKLTHTHTHTQTNKETQAHTQHLSSLRESVINISSKKKRIIFVCTQTTGTTYRIVVKHERADAGDHDDVGQRVSEIAHTHGRHVGVDQVQLEERADARMRF